MLKMDQELLGLFYHGNLSIIKEKLMGEDIDKKNRQSWLKQFIIDYDKKEEEKKKIAKTKELEKNPPKKAV